MKKPSSPSGIIPPDKFGTAVCEALESIGKNQLLEHRQVQALSLDLTIRTFEVNGMPKKKKLMWPRLALHDRNELFYRHSEKNDALFTDEAINEATEKLACRTDTGKPGHIRGTMEQETNDRTVLVYDMVDNHVRILRILFPELLK